MVSLRTIVTYESDINGGFSPELFIISDWPLLGRPTQSNRSFVTFIFVCFHAVREGGTEVFHSMVDP